MSNEKTPATTDEDLQRRLKRLEEIARLQRFEDRKKLMATPEGRRAVHELLIDCGVWAPSFTADPLVTAYREGRRSVGLDLLDELKRDHGPYYVHMLNEALALQRDAS